MGRFLLGVAVGGVLAVTAPVAAEGFVWIAEQLPGAIHDLIGQLNSTISCGESAHGAQAYSWEWPHNPSSSARR